MMFSITRIEKMNNPLYQSVDKLYESAFPYHERRDERAMLDKNNYHLDAWYHNIMLVGFIGYWTFKDYFYIEHLVINDSPQIGKRLRKMV